MYKPQEKTDLSLMRSVNDILQSPANLCRWNLQGKTVYTLCKKVEPYNIVPERSCTLEDNSLPKKEVNIPLCIQATLRPDKVYISED